MLFAAFHLSPAGCESSKGKKPRSCPRGIHGPPGKALNKQARDAVA